ncbi:MAG TPA: S41 family peptidase, partial [Anaeromyxobacter sp.]
EADPLTPVSTLIANGTVGSAFGPATTGLTRLFDVVPRGGGQTQRRPMSKALYSLDPVPAAGIQVLDPTGTGTPKVGYLALRTFISPADARLDAAFATFKTAGVTDVIVDLRYNGGGLVSTAEHLANLLAGGLAGTMYELSNNPRHAASNFNQVFTPATSSLAPAHVAFLVSGATASAGELVPNVLAPARTTSLALVGRQTYGKPVGQRGFTSSQCGVVVFLVSFKIANGAGFGDYFGGLPAPGFAGCSVPATDDLVHETWDPAETQTAAALQWLTSGSCPALPPGPLAAGAVAPADAYPEAVQPTEAQRHVRGLF